MKTKTKKILHFNIILIFIFTLISSIFSLNANAYSNPSLREDLEVGLISMSSTTLNASLYGNYILNGSPLPEVTTLSIKPIDGMVNINGTNYMEAKLTSLSKDSFITLSSETGTYKYKGSFLFKTSADKILPVNLIDMDTYLKGVVGYEMSDSFPIEALKAQAVAARNFALSKLGYESSQGYDFDDTVKYQVYKGYDERLKNSIRAVDETSGIVLIFNDKLVEALYSASHGGYTEDSINVWGNSAPYLKSKQDSFDDEPWSKVNITFTNRQIDSILKSKGYIALTDTFLNLDLTSVTKFVSGRVSNINIIYRDINGITRAKSVTKDRSRTFLALPSNMYNVSYDSSTGLYTFSGKGRGHGLGMSQIGARNRAISGQSFEEILKFYYDGSNITKAVPSSTFFIPQIANDDKLSIVLGSALKIISEKVFSTR
jgi:SpoIID/LytB domain protein